MKTPMMPFLTTLLSLALGAAACAQETKPAPPENAAKPPATRSDFHIYLLMGQSNMVGRDTEHVPAPLNNPRILSLDPKEQWVIAKDPLHPAKNKRKSGVGPGMSFAVEMLKSKPRVTIGLIPCAAEGSQLSDWVKGGKCYEAAVKRAKSAAGSGVIKGVLWHHGEKDAKVKDFAITYKDRLVTMITDLRADLGQPELPFVIGQLGEFVTKDRNPFVDELRKSINRVPSAIKNVDVISSSGLEPVKSTSDKLYFDAESQEKLGKRYAAAMRKLER